MHGTESCWAGSRASVVLSGVVRCCCRQSESVVVATGLIFNHTKKKDENLTTNTV